MYKKSDSFYHCSVFKCFRRLAPDEDDVTTVTKLSRDDILELPELAVRLLQSDIIKFNINILIGTCFTESQVLYFQSNCYFSIATSRGLSSGARMFPSSAGEPREGAIGNFKDLSGIARKNPFPEIYRKDSRRVILNRYFVTGKKKSFSSPCASVIEGINK